MKKMALEQLEWELEFLTPGFVGKANQISPNELMSSSIKGMLRFWYRALVHEAVDSNSDWFEPRVFGANKQQSSFLLRTQLLPRTSIKIRAEDLHEELKKFKEGKSRHARNGAIYLGYSLFLKKNKKRYAWAPGVRIHCRAIFTHGSTDKYRKGFLGALWVLGHFGGLGSRNRRGFGAVRLVNWKTNDSKWQLIMEQLPLLGGVESLDAWSKQFEEVQYLFRQWFKRHSEEVFWPHLGSKTSYWLGRHRDKDWKVILNTAGRILQDFRLRREPDYKLVKKSILENNKNNEDKDGSNNKKSVPPICKRCAFGLPLTFRYSKIKGEMTFEPCIAVKSRMVSRHRWPSLLIVRPILIADYLHPFFLRLDGPVPGQEQLIQVCEKDSRQLIRQADAELLDVFMKSLQGARQWIG